LLEGKGRPAKLPQNGRRESSCGRWNFSAVCRPPLPGYLSPRPMNANSPIALVAVTYARSGTEQIVLDLSRRLASEGRPVYVIVPRGPASLDRLEVEAQASGATVVRTPPLYPGDRNKLESFKALVGFFTRVKPAVAHFHIPRPLSGFEAIAAAYAARVPIRLRTDQNPVMSNPSRTERLRLAVADSLVHRIVFVSEENRRTHRARFGRPERKCRVIHNGIDPATISCDRTDDNRRTIREELKLPQDATLALLLGALEERKGGMDFVRALAVATAKQPLLRGVVVGDGDMRASMERLADELRVADRLHFLGRRPDARRLFGAFDFYVQPSHYEGMALSMLEALAAGLPMVTTRVAGVEEVCRGDKGAIVVEVGDTNALGEGMIRLASEPGTRSSLSDVSRPRVRDHFTIDRVYQEYRALYQSLGLR